MDQAKITRGAVLVDLATGAYNNKLVDLPHFEASTATPPNLSSGYFGIAYRDEFGRVYIAHRGTDSFKPDIVPNDLQFSYQIPNQFKDAYQFTEEAARYFGVEMDQIIHVGHSLGGGLGKLMSLATGAEAWAYNAPPGKSFAR